MAMSGLYLWGTLVTLPILVALFGLRHAGKNGAWWSMAAAMSEEIHQLRRGGITS